MHFEVDRVSQLCSLQHVQLEPDHHDSETPIDMSLVRALGRVEAVDPIASKGSVEAYLVGRKFQSAVSAKNQVVLVFNKECQAWKYQFSGDQFRDQLHAFVITVEHKLCPPQRFEGPRFRIICARRASTLCRVPSLYGGYNPRSQVLFAETYNDVGVTFHDQRTMIQPSHPDDPIILPLGRILKRKYPIE